MNSLYRMSNDPVIYIDMIWVTIGLRCDLAVLDDGVRIYFGGRSL